MLEGGDGVCGVSRYEYVMIECGDAKVGWEMGDKIRKAREADGAFVVTILCLHARWAHHNNKPCSLLRGWPCRLWGWYILVFCALTLVHLESCR
jgi:hypothetical protein